MYTTHTDTLKSGLHFNESFLSIVVPTNLFEHMKQELVALMLFLSQKLKIDSNHVLWC